jgi:hypothetical protein
MKNQKSIFVWCKGIELAKVLSPIKRQSNDISLCEISNFISESESNLEISDVSMGGYRMTIKHAGVDYQDGKLILKFIELKYK